MARRDANKPIRVLMVTTSFPLTGEDSSGVFVKNLVAHFQPSISVTVLVPDSEKDKSPEPVNGYCLHRFRYAPKTLQVLAHGPGGIPRALKTNPLLYLLLPCLFLSMFFACFRMAKKADIIHANWGMNGAICGVAGCLAGVPVITSLRGTDVKRLEGSGIDRMFTWLCLATNKKVVAVSHTIQNDIIRRYPIMREKILHISNGVGEDFLKLANPTTKSSIFRCIAIASLYPEKGIHILLEAMAMTQNLASLRLVVIGDGPQKRALHRLSTKFGLEKHVRFEGKVSHSRIPGFMEKADCLILPSLSEGRPNVVLEAMAAGKTIIASDIGPVRELIDHGKTGLLFKTGDSKSLCKAIDKVATAPLQWEILGKASRKMILERGLTWEISAQNHAKLYKKILSGRR